MRLGMGQGRQLAIEVSQAGHRLENAAEGRLGGRQESKVQGRQRRGEYRSTGSGRECLLQRNPNIQKSSVEEKFSQV